MYELQQCDARVDVRMSLFIEAPTRCPGDRRFARASVKDAPITVSPAKPSAGVWPKTTSTGTFPMCARARVRSGLLLHLVGYASCRRSRRKLSARRTNVIARTAAALMLAIRLPDTFDTPPIRQRWPTGISTARQAGRGHPHQHFQVPAVSGVAHAELKQGIPADGAKRRKIAEARAIDHPQKQIADKPGRDLRRRQASGVAPCRECASR